MRQWYKIRSWHIVTDDQLVPGPELIMRMACGRTVDKMSEKYDPFANVMRDTLPDGRTCETCFRVMAS